ncbi:MAG: ABC transporter substrate-binding protein [Minwuia sp.]|uniref:ABC transporter substrate-binding protein n=1 Tax=Minwuia sp. TaxID=2493630 RepID=UPI003A83EAB8
MIKRLKTAVVTGFTLLALAAPAAAETLRLGVLEFGTVAWELDTIRHHGLDRAEGIELEVVGFAGKQAAAIAFQGGEVDAIVSDIVWVARQREAGRAITFAPYSSTVGAVMVPAVGPVQSIPDLKGRKIGVAGGPLDKSWLLLRALTKRDQGFDLSDEAEAVFGAPPLLRKQFEGGGMDALLTFWHYAARLEAAGYRRLADMNGIAEAIAGVRDVAIVGYVFSPELSAPGENRAAAFLRASLAAKRLMLNDDAEWERLRPLTRAASDEELATLRQRFREGIPRQFGDAEIAAARNLYAVLAGIGGKALVGDANELDAAAYHPAARF